MPVKGFLNDYLRIAICLFGMILMGYYLFAFPGEESFADNQTLVRTLVFLGFAYLLSKSILRILRLHSRKDQ
jgi:hypothetical protein